MSRDFFTAAERAALDIATVPGLSTGFADDVVAAAMARPAATVRRRPVGLHWRDWGRGTRILLGFGALALAGATAAAAGGGLLNHLPEKIPQIAAAVGLTSPPPQRAVQVRHEKRPLVQRREASALATVPPLTPEQIEARRVRVAAYRAAVLAGELPPSRVIVRRAVARKIGERVAAMPPEQQERVRDAIESRFLANHPVIAERLRERGALTDAGTLSPEARAERAERRRAWRERGFEALAKDIAEPFVEETLGPDTPGTPATETKR